MSVFVFFMNFFYLEQLNILHFLVNFSLKKPYDKA